MSKLYAALAAIALVFVLAAPAPADAAERRPDGMRNLDQHEFSSQRRRFRHRHWGPRHYWGPRHRFVRRYHWGPRYYWGPRYRYGYYGYPYYRPWRPAPVFWGPGVFAGPFGVGFGFGPRWWW